MLEGREAHFLSIEKVSHYINWLLERKFMRAHGFVSSYNIFLKVSTEILTYCSKVALCVLGLPKQMIFE